LGGMSGVGKTTAARRVARRYDLWLYSIDARTWKHAEAMQVPALTMSPDEMWLERSPDQMAQDFLDEADERFALIKDEVAAIPDDGRRYDNDAAIDQWRRYAEHEPLARELTIGFACECDQPGCESVVEVSFDRTIHRPFLGHRATVRP
jgi:hypothetical protein